MEYEELCSGSTVKEHQKDYERFFTVKETPKRGRKVEYNQEAIDVCRKNSVGWLVLATNDVKDPVKALEIYRMKDTIEKHLPLISATHWQTSYEKQKQNSIKTVSVMANCII